MKTRSLMLTVAPLALLLPAFSPAYAADADAKPANSAETTVQDSAPAAPSAPTAPRRENFSTGVAKARDLLDSAISTSSLDAEEILKFSPRSLSDLLRDVPGVRSDASQGEGYGNISIRGLPIAATGSKYVQLQEDGLPVLEFGDIAFASADTYLRLDTMIGQVQAIRGGSASTFASNSPGGVINILSKTGLNEGGSIQTTFGLDYRSYRTDIEYGAPISDTLRFQIGGFYRRGEGVRRTGYDGQDGGQIKLNVTKEFNGGYIRVYGKYLNDRTPAYGYLPVQVTGTNDKPSYSDIPGFDMKRDTVLNRNFTTIVGLDGNNQPSAMSARNGMHPIVKSVGLEAKFDVAGWSIIERMRYAGISGSFTNPEFNGFAPAAAVLGRIGAFGGTLRYAAGPNKGQTITNPTALNGNGLLNALTLSNVENDSLDNFTNDVRASRTWNLGSAPLTTTFGFYRSRQNINSTHLWTSVIEDVVGNGNGTLIDVFAPNGTQITQNGQYGFGAALLGGCCRQQIISTYDVSAPYGSLNLKLGKLSLGASTRYDMGSVNGTLTTANGFSSFDFNGDGVISDAESRTSRLDLGAPGLLDYSYNNLSYSLSANYRFTEVLSAFGRYSRGGRANADRIVAGEGYFNFGTGNLLRSSDAVDTVKQAEGGVKFRTDAIMLNLTGFWAESGDTNIDPRNGAPIDRVFRAKGLEFEGSYSRGIASISAGATYTKAKIETDRIDPSFNGKTPRNQADLIFQVTPQINTDRFSIGAIFIGTTGSYASDENLLRIPGYVTTSGFAQFRATDRLLLSLNVANLFDAQAITGVFESSIPAGGLVQARTLPGRTTSATVRFDF